MLTSLLYLITGIIGFATMAIILFKYKNSIFVNKYFILVFSLSTIRFLIRGSAYFIKGYPIEEGFIYLEFLFLITIPCIYLYFKDMIAYEKWNDKQILHFFPVLISISVFLINSYGTPLPKIIFIIVIIGILISYLTYIVLTYKLLVKNIWSRKSNMYIINKQNKLIRNWSLFLFSCYILLFFRIVALFLLKSYNYSLTSNSNYFWISAVTWLLIFIKMLLTPELLYGYDLLQEKINEYKNHNIALDNVWKINSNPVITNIKDHKIKEKVTYNLKNYIYQIESLSFYSNTFRNPAINLEELAKKLNIPTFHLVYIFKYHSNISFVDYKKIIRIQDAIKLLESDFLSTNTYESLAKEVGFKSYMPFYNSFKNITGLPPQEYYTKFYK